MWTKEAMGVNEFNDSKDSSTMIYNFVESVIQFEISYYFLVVPPGFEPGSPGPKPEMMDHYTTGL